MKMKVFGIPVLIIAAVFAYVWRKSIMEFVQKHVPGLNKSTTVVVEE